MVHILLTQFHKQYKWWATPRECQNHPTNITGQTLQFTHRRCPRNEEHDIWEIWAILFAKTWRTWWHTTWSCEATGRVAYHWWAVTLHYSVQVQLLLLYIDYDLQVAGPKSFSKACHRSQLMTLPSQTQTYLASSCSCQQYLIEAKDFTGFLCCKTKVMVKSKEKRQNSIIWCP